MLFFDDSGDKKFGKYSSKENIRHLSSKFSYEESKIFDVEEIKN